MSTLFPSSTARPRILPAVRILTAVIVALIALPASIAQASEHEEHEEPEEQEHPDFGYEGALGPPFWGKLQPAFATCATGQRQSPIDLRGARRSRARRIRLDYRPTPLSIENDGHTFDAKPRRRQTMAIGRKRFRLVQFHAHTPSEHALDGRRFRLELHFVHKAADGQHGVLAVVVRAGRRNDAFGEVFEAVPRAGRTAELERRVSLYDLLPASRRAFRYAGSLTTPPCTEGIRWAVLRQPVEFSRQQLSRFRSLFESNARPLRPRNGRALRLG